MARMSFGSDDPMSQAIRVVHVIARMNVGGPAVLIADTVRHMDSEDFDVRLITGNCADNEADYLQTQASDIQAIRIGGLGRSISPLNDATALRHMVDQLRDLQPHIVHTHTAKAGALGRLAAQLAPIDARVVHTFHGHLLHGYFSSLKTKGLIATEAFLARRSDRLVAVSAEVRDDLLAAGVGRVQQYAIIPPGVSLRSLPDRDTARAALQLPREGHVVLLLGRVTRIKRPDRFAEAARIVHRAMPDVHFLIAGSGDLAAELGTTMRDMPASLLGWRSDVETLLAASDALVLTSDNEGTPLSVIQAGLAGIPTVATRVGGLPSVVDDGTTGVLVDCDPRAVANGLSSLLEQDSIRRAMGDRARQQMTARFGIRAMIENHANLYHQMLES